MRTYGEHRRLRVVGCDEHGERNKKSASAPTCAKFEEDLNDMRERLRVMSTMSEFTHPEDNSLQRSVSFISKIVVYRRLVKYFQRHVATSSGSDHIRSQNAPTGGRWCGFGRARGRQVRVRCARTEWLRR